MTKNARVMRLQKYLDKTMMTNMTDYADDEMLPTIDEAALTEQEAKKLKKQRE